jgi:hypothetical protein
MAVVCAQLAILAHAGQEAQLKEKDEQMAKSNPNFRGKFAKQFDCYELLGKFSTGPKVINHAGLKGVARYDESKGKIKFITPNACWISPEKVAKEKPFALGELGLSCKESPKACSIEKKKRADAIELDPKAFHAEIDPQDEAWLEKEIGVSAKVVPSLSDDEIKKKMGLDHSPEHEKIRRMKEMKMKLHESCSSSVSSKDLAAVDAKLTKIQPTDFADEQKANKEYVAGVAEKK